MALVFFGVTCKLAPLIADLDSDSDYNPNVAAVTADVTFRAKILDGDVLKSFDASPPTMYVPVPIVGTVDSADGILKLRSTPDSGGAGTYAPVRLLGNSDSLDLDGELWYEFTFANLRIDNRPTGITIAGGAFPAPDHDTTVDLIDYMRTTGVTATGEINRIAPTEVRLDGGDIIFSFANADIPSPIPFEPVFVSTEITDAGTVGLGLVQSETVSDALDVLEAATAGRSLIQSETAADAWDVLGVAPAENLPSYVDDVVEFANQAAFPAEGETGKIYVALDNNDSFRWSGSAYVRISDRVTASGITDSTTVGRALVTAASATAARTTISAVGKGELVVNVKDYGATGDGTTDDTTAIQAAFTAAHTTDSAATVFFPGGDYLVSGTIPITKTMSVRGAARGTRSDGGTQIVVKDTATTVFTVEADSVEFSSIYFGCQSTASNVLSQEPKAIRYISGHRGVVEKCLFGGWYDAVSFEGCDQFAVRENVWFWGYHHNLIVNNVINWDNGDPSITGNNFWGPADGYDTEAHIYARMGGGLRVMNNKFIGGQYHLLMAVGDEVWASSGVTSSTITMFCNNSTEYATVSSVKFTHEGPSNTGRLGHVIVSGNQITAVACTGPAIDIAPVSGGGFFGSFLVSNNLSYGTAGSTVFVHVQVADNVTVAGNSFLNGVTGVQIDSNAGYTLVAASNKFQNITTTVSNASAYGTDLHTWSRLASADRTNQRVTGTTHATTAFTYDTSASGVNYLQFNNNVSGGPPTIYAKGSDTDIGIALTPKGAGAVSTGGYPVVTTGATQSLSNKTLVAPVLGTPASGTLTNCTGLPVAGISASTSTALGVGSIELGHASDTTLSRSAAGKLAVEGIPVQLNGEQMGAKMRSGLYYGPNAVTGSVAYTLNSLFAIPMFIPRAVTLDRIGVNITSGGTTGSQVLVGIYADIADAAGGYPGDLVANSTATLTTETSGFKEGTISCTLQPGLYWLAAVAQTAAPTGTMIYWTTQTVGYQSSGFVGNRSAYRQTSVTGALPSTFSTSVDAQGSPPWIQIRVA